jgi:hypothetical protein
VIVETGSIVGDPGAPSADANGPGVTRRSASSEETLGANRRWWDGAADAYQEEHGDFLRAGGFVW